MGMVVQHNINAQTAYNKLNTNVAGMKKASERLASGFRINRAGDDAAGLAISEKMRAQIRGLNQAVRNSQDGINMVQTYEGAAQETHNLLMRMKELATESANGTYDNTTDRDAIELEFRQLNDELDQLADTDFNGRVALNGGTMADGAIIVNNRMVAGKAVVDTNNIQDSSSILVYHGGVYGQVDRSGTGHLLIDGVHMPLVSGEHTAELHIGDTYYVTNTAVFVPDPGMTFPGRDDGLAAHSVYKITDDTHNISIYGWNFEIQRDANGTPIGLVGDDNVPVTALYGQAVQFSRDEIKVVRPYKLAPNGDMLSAPITSGLEGNDDKKVGHVYISLGVSQSDAFEHGRRNLTFSNHVALQIGARSKDIVDFTFEYVSSGIGDLDADLNISSRGLGTNQLTLSTSEKANEAIDHIDNAINKVSMVRATFGAIQNRLEHKIDNLTTTSSNLTEAESNIRDTDMAQEMMSFTKYNILQQAAQSMLSQANQQPQSILQLIGG